ncbi:hypothetical protein JHK86_000465 [Glycine max]|nr:hypothetical protein JHK86_000465 [Glycine max]
MDDLQCETPSKESRVSENLNKIKDRITQIINNGYAYEVDGNVFYVDDKCPNYGMLSRQRLAHNTAGEKVVVGSRKCHPTDFALWKAAKLEIDLMRKPMTKERGRQLCKRTPTRALGRSRHGESEIKSKRRVTRNQKRKNGSSTSHNHSFSRPAVAVRCTTALINRDDQTTFFFTNFQETHKAKDMWNIFHLHGKIMEVYIPTKMDRRGEIFRFSRFESIADPQILSLKLDKIFIGN